MKLLIDTHLLIWAAGASKQLPLLARELMADRSNMLYFSAVSIWEVAIKQNLQRADFLVDARSLRRHLLDNGYLELCISSEHSAGVASLPNIDHKDPFDRLLVSQAICEGLPLLTNDEQLPRYGACVLNANDVVSAARWRN
jgi:PIN domain nuclease of toxin-antitoxin system